MSPEAEQAKWSLSLGVNGNLYDQRFTCKEHVDLYTIYVLIHMEFNTVIENKFLKMGKRQFLRVNTFFN